MPITKLKTSIKKVTNIIHVADIHIRLTKRHEEYNTIFDHLYNDIRKQDENTIICLLGDIFHNKSELSPECVRSAKDLFYTLAELRPTIIVAGNHDATLTNRNRLDSLSPIVEALNHPNLHYLRKSGLYGFANILFNNMSVFDDPKDYIRWENIPNKLKLSYDKFIALFHGPVNNALTDLGYTIVSKSHPVSIFDGHDIVLLGDIHMKQDLQLYNPEEGLPAIHYCGSLIQQNHGESLEGHGYSLWDLEKVKYTHVEIPNEYGHFTIDIEKGKLNTDLKNIPKKARLRIRCFESIATEVKAVLAKVRKVSDISDIIYVRVSSPNDKKLRSSSSVLSGNLTDVAYQNKLITEHLKKVMKVVDNKSIENVLKVNEETNSKIKKDEFSRNIRWRPKVFEFDNMFSYGEGNVIDFSKLNDVVGIFASNASGKSSILSALSFCIFDKCDRAFKASEILNNQKMSFRCRFNFEINGIDYFIERYGKSDKKGNVPVNVKFWKMENGEEIELHGEGRRDTNEVIRDYLGSYDDFILTALSVQSAKNNASFIDMGQCERKDLLSQFIGLTLFDRLYNLSYERHKELSILLKEFNNDDFTQRLVELRDALQATQGSYNDAKSEYQRRVEERFKLNSQVIKKSKEFVNTSLKVIDIAEAERQKSNIEKKIKKKQTDVQKSSQSVEDVQKRANELQEKINEHTNKKTEESYAKFVNYDSEWKKTKTEVDKKKIEVRAKLDKLEKLSKHEYDPNCKYCVNNAFVKDALKTQEELPKEKEETRILLDRLEEFSRHRDHWSYAKRDYELLMECRNKLSELREECNDEASELAKLNATLNDLKSELENIEKSIEFYHSHQKDIESNKKIQKEIDDLNLLIKNSENRIETTNKKIIELNGKIILFKSQIETIKCTVDKAKSIEDEYEAYDLYIQCVGRDGIPYEVISSTVPEIEKEVNNILNQIVEFSIELELDGKNITPFIVYDKNRWALTLSSGLERFISSLAIRVGLINISNLPRPNFLVIDEGFGCADADNLASMSTLFAYLKTNFDFILAVSHLDALKDMVDNHIEIQKEHGFSKVHFA